MKVLSVILSQDQIKKIFHSVYMIEQPTHDICFVIILHIRNIPLVHRSDEQSNSERAGGRARRAGSREDAVRPQPRGAVHNYLNNKLLWLPREVHSSQIIILTGSKGC